MKRSSAISIVGPMSRLLFSFSFYKQKGASDAVLDQSLFFNKVAGLSRNFVQKRDSGNSDFQ